MEQAKRVKLSDGTLIEADPARPYSRFLKIMTGPAVIRFTLADAEAMYAMLAGYFAQREVVEAHGDLADLTDLDALADQPRTDES